MKSYGRMKILGFGLTLVLASKLGWCELSDRQMGHKIHSAVVEDNTLPYCAHKVKVNAKDGKVTLIGRVHTEEQKEKIGEKAATIAGDDNVTNNIMVSLPK